ncbi:MAG: NTP transferase domain-containing protein [Vulcanimicrobiota bacterium]
MSFPDKVEVVLLAGGQFKDLPPDEPVPSSKGLLPIGGRPMAARTLDALVGSERVGRVIMVTPHSVEEFSDPAWEGVDHLAPAGERLIDSFRSGMENVLDPSIPAMVVAGDLPFLTARAVDDFVERCSQRPEAAVWYGFLSRETCEAGFPGIPHTWARLASGTYCGGGFFMSRPDCLNTLYASLTALTYARKNPLKLASLLGWGTILAFLLRRLTIPAAEAAVGRLLGGLTCAGIESPYAEVAFNIDDQVSLAEARRRLEGPK